MTPRPPDFLGIGAQRAGTTWLWESLSLHPGVWLPEGAKEIHYFDEISRRGPDVRSERRRRRLRRLWRSRTRHDLGWQFRFILGRRNDDWYRSLFAPAGGRLTGDVTPEYLALERAEIGHAARVAPDARLIVMVRNPIERMWSVLWFFPRLRRRLVAGDPSVFELLQKPYHRRMGDYGAGIERWADRFGPDRIYVGFLEDAALHPEALVADIADFLDLDGTVVIPAPRTNVSKSPGAIPHEALAALVAAATPLVAAQQSLGGYAPWWSLSTAVLAESGGTPLPLHERAEFGWWERDHDGRRLRSGRLDRLTSTT